MTALTSADLARVNNEPLYGTANSARIWFLLEYNGVYTRKVWDDARIPDEVKAKLDAYPDSHKLLIRQPEQVNAHDRITSFFVVDARTHTPVSYSLELSSYTDLLDIDLDAVLAGTVVAPSTDPLYVICTNGKRDICCAKYGIALYNAMVLRGGQQVWQSSHIGGHRFAGTLYCFPDAICYGYLDADDAEAVIYSYEHNRILLDKLRGHGIYDKPIQVAEYFLLRALENNRLNAVHYLSHEFNTEEQIWTVNFDDTESETTYQVRIGIGKPLQVIATTGDETFKEVPQYKFIDYQAR
ncbi:MAG: sucrase ferredoxin [Anaerolineae bacterium]